MRRKRYREKRGIKTRRTARKQQDLNEDGEKDEKKCNCKKKYRELKK